MRRYVVGLAHDGQYMAFIRKNRPEWQAGLLNGIGGKVEPGEHYRDAMVREFEEETGYRIEAERWDPLVSMEYPDQAEIAFYSARVSLDELWRLKSMTDEKVEVHAYNHVEQVPRAFVRNLRWIVPLARHEEKYAVTKVIGYVDQVEGNIVKAEGYS